ncbi:MAG: GNAT family N-acetyltransferase [Clostridia bacterium]|nr:GNAT family N-acetyltransferase [Clostridia bacterium]
MTPQPPDRDRIPFGAEAPERGQPMIRLRPMVRGDLALFEHWLSAPHVQKWYGDPAAWLYEAAEMDGLYGWIVRFIAERDGVPVGFCQYYACCDSGEDWAHYTRLGGSYSVDYLIGDAADLNKGYGKQMLAALEREIGKLPGARRIVVRPEPLNTASRALLRSAGYALDTATDIFVKELRPKEKTP